jgi:hypothetical protein
VRVVGGSPVLIVYAVVGKVPASLGLGVDGVHLRTVTGERLAAVVGEHRRMPELGDDQFWTHEALIARLAKETTVLPLRFGTTVGGEQELSRWLRSHEDRLLELLDAVRGAVELSVRAEVPPSTGSAETFHQSLAALARRSILFGAGPGSDRLRAAYLVDGAGIEGFVREVDRMVEELGIEVSCTGPWPPYSFVAEVAR